MSAEIGFTWKVAQRTYASTVDEQLEQLKTDELVLRFAELKATG